MPREVPPRGAKKKGIRFAVCYVCCSTLRSHCRFKSGRSALRGRAFGGGPGRKGLGRLRVGLANQPGLTIAYNFSLVPGVGFEF